MILLLDGITVLIIIVFAVTAYIRGFLNTVIRFAGTVAATVLSVTVSRPAAEFIFDSYIADKVEAVVHKHMSEISAADVSAFADGMGELLDELPKLFSNILRSGFGVHAGEWYEKVVQNHSDSLVASVIDSIIAPLATGLIRALVFFAVFTLLMFIVNAVAGLFIGVNRIPLIGSLNEVLGAVLGAAQGMLYVFVIAAVVWLALSAAGGEIGPLSASMVEKTILFKHFYNIGPWVRATAGLI